ncbi:MAG: signal peptidase I [Actinomycetaceae bacterium]|nr:signal peptidase I [Actinomycetaceae bacterium]
MVTDRPRHIAPGTTHAPLDNESEDAQERPRSLLVRLSEYALILIIALVISAGVRLFLVQAFWIPSGSMEETLAVGDNVLVSRLTPTVSAIDRGDVVVFHDELEWLNAPPEQVGVKKYVYTALEFVGLRPARGDQHLIKRVVGLGGDHVVCCDSSGLLQINGQSVNEPYVAPGSDNALQPFDVTVPEGKLWVMGDNRNHSADSRAHMREPSGPFVDEDAVVGRVLFVSWPIKHWSNPNDNDTFATVPDAH